MWKMDAHMSSATTTFLRTSPGDARDTCDYPGMSLVRVLYSMNTGILVS